DLIVTGVQTCALPISLQNVKEFDRVLTHELTHAMLRSVASRNLPAWLNEGLAMSFEGYDAQAIERDLAAAHVFVPLSALRTSFRSEERRVGKGCRSRW